jgi:hypothetical protein
MRSVKLVLLVFCLGLGFAVAYVAISRGIDWYRSRPSSPKVWPNYSANERGVVFSLTTQYREDGVKYHFSVALANEELRGAFEEVAQNIPKGFTSDVFTARLTNTAGVELCKFGISFGDLRPRADTARNIRDILADGTDPSCSRQEYEESSGWRLDYVFPDLHWLSGSPSQAKYPESFALLRGKMQNLPPGQELAKHAFWRLMWTESQRGEVSPTQ